MDGKPAQAVRWAAVLLVLLGAGVVAVAAWLPAAPAVPGPPGWLGAGWFVLPVSLAGMVVLAMYGRDEPKLRLVRFRWWCASTAVVLGWPVRWAWGYTGDDLASGLPVPAPPLFAAGSSLMLTGALVLIVVGPARPTRWSVVGAASGVVVTGLAVLVTIGTVLTGPLDATTAAAARPVATVSSATGRAWTWEVPPGQRVRHVVSGGSGVVVLVDDGVVALDGTTGRERWRYRRTGAVTGDLGVSPGGGTVLVTFTSSVEGAAGGRIVGLDAMTGEAGFDELFGGSGPKLDMTDRVLLGGDLDDGVLRGYDLRTGEESWSYRPPEECRWSHGAAGHDIVLVGLVCVPGGAGDVTITVRLLGLDDRTGRERWHADRTMTGTAAAVDDFGRWGLAVPDELAVSTDGAAARFVWRDTVAGRAKRELLVTVSTGAVPAAGSFPRAGGEALLDVTGGSCAVTVTVTPRDGAPARVIDVDLRERDDDRCTLTPHVESAPGAMVVWASGSSRLVGLA